MLAAGNPAEACAACVQLEELAGNRNSSLLDALAAQSRGAVELTEGNPPAALRTLRRAFEAWQTLEAPYEAARVRVLIAQACRALGDEETAALELDAARGAFSRLHAGADISRVDALLLNVASASAHGLTTRELEVLRHVAAGKSNKTIARDLGLSERTVDRHVSNIFDKLGVSSRAAATAFACRSHLV
jgi:DNA-binding CsgD family transcriptional regulator